MAGFEILNDEEIIQAVNPSLGINDAENEEEDFKDSMTISHNKGLQALTTALKYLEQRNELHRWISCFLKICTIELPVIETLDFCSER